MSTTRSRRLVKFGDVLLAQIAQKLPPGSEQQGTRPVVVVVVPAQLGPQRFDVLVIVPLTRATGALAENNPMLYPRLTTGQGRLPLSSTAMIDHVQAIDAARVVKHYGALNADEYAPLQRNLALLFGLEGT